MIDSGAPFHIPIETQTRRSLACTIFMFSQFEATHYSISSSLSNSSPNQFWKSIRLFEETFANTTKLVINPELFGILLIVVYYCYLILYFSFARSQI